MNVSDKNMMQYVGLASQWLVMLGVSVWLGYELDNIVLKWKFPLFIILLPLASLILSLYKIIKNFSSKK